MLIVIPYRSGGKSRLPEELRLEVSLAMLGDVVEAAVAVGDVRVVTDDSAAGLVVTDLGATTVEDPGGGQGAAVGAALRGAAGVCLVVNADLPMVRPSDLNALAVPPVLGKLAIVEARDGTTNALGLPNAGLFEPLYGPGSAGRFRAHAVAHGVEIEEPAIPSLVDDVDTLADLEWIGFREGSRTTELLEAISG